MRTVGIYAGASYSPDGEPQITFTIENPSEIQKLEETKNSRLIVSAEIFREARSKHANRYLWHILDLMAKKIGSDKDTMYRLMLSRYGVFTDMDVVRGAIPILERHFRVVERFRDGYEDGEMVTVRCYYGSSKYNTKEMSELLNGVIQDAKDIGVDTATEDEIRAMIAAWKGGD